MDGIKNNLNFQTGNQYFYWRDNNEVEIDLIQYNGNSALPIEIKSAQTYTKDFEKKSAEIHGVFRSEFRNGNL